MDYKSHLLTNDYSWIDSAIKDMGHKAFKDLYNRIYVRLDAMQPGEVFDLKKKVRTETTPLFMKIACQFIIDTTTRPFTNLWEFCDNYSTIKRNIR